MKINAKIPSSKDKPATAEHSEIRVLRHAQICQKLGLSSAKLFDMVAKGIFPEPFTLVPGGRAVGWLEHEIDHWIIQRRECAKQEPVLRKEKTKLAIGNPKIKSGNPISKA
jgi:prophage regulatory protein